MLSPTDQGQSTLEDGLQAAQQRFKATSKAMKLSSFTATRLGDLAKLGDTIVPEDVVEAAGAIVGKGGSALQMATALSTMPTEGGEQLAGWVAQRAATFAQITQQMAQAHEQARHQMATAGLRSVAGHVVAGHMGAAAPQGAEGGPASLGASPAPQGAAS